LAFSNGSIVIGNTAAPASASLFASAWLNAMAEESGSNPPPGEDRSSVSPSPNTTGEAVPRRLNLLQTVRLMSEVKVVRRWNRSRSAAPAANGKACGTSVTTHGVRLIGIGASTGGPPVLQSILHGLPKDFPVPLLIVQHISPGFLPGMVEWLNQTTSLRVQVAAHGVVPLPGHAYVAPDDFHLGITLTGRIMLAREAPENGVRPAVAYLFRSLANHCGASAIGVLLTGMGKDGAVELKRMRDCGATTIAQDRDSSIVHGMPGEAIQLGAASLVLAADQIAGALIAHVGRTARGELEP